MRSTKYLKESSNTFVKPDFLSNYPNFGVYNQIKPTNTNNLNLNSHLFYTNSNFYSQRKQNVINPEKDPKVHLGTSNNFYIKENKEQKYTNRQLTESTPRKTKTKKVFSDQSSIDSKNETIYPQTKSKSRAHIGFLYEPKNSKEYNTSKGSSIDGENFQIKYKNLGGDLIASKAEYRLGKNNASNANLNKTGGNTSIKKDLNFPDKLISQISGKKPSGKKIIQSNKQGIIQLSSKPSINDREISDYRNMGSYYHRDNLKNQHIYIVNQSQSNFQVCHAFSFSGNLSINPLTDRSDDSFNTDRFNSGILKTNKMIQSLEKANFNLGRKADDLKNQLDSYLKNYSEEETKTALYDFYRRISLALKKVPLPIDKITQQKKVFEKDLNEILTSLEQ